MTSMDRGRRIALCGLVLAVALAGCQSDGVAPPAYCESVVVTTLAGNGTRAIADGTGGATGTAELADPVQVAVDAVGNAFVADNIVREIAPDGTTTTLAGAGNYFGPRVRPRRDRRLRRAAEAAVAFQWSTQARYVMDLRFDYFWGCIVVAERAFNRLSPPDQSLVRDAAARLRERAELVGRETDNALLGGLFQKQGLTVLPVPEQMHAELFATAEGARSELTTRFVSRQLLERVLAILADYRGEQLPHR